jgi:hypothetical protein
MSGPEGVSPERASGFLSLPATEVGKWSAWLLLVSLGLILLNNLVVMPLTKQGASLELVQRAFNLVVFLCVLSSGVTGLFAIVMRGERSWAVFLAVLLALAAAALNVGSLVRGRRGP